MLKPAPTWTDKQTLDLRGFNPVPVRTWGGLHVLYRRHHGTYATRYAEDYSRPIGPEYLIHPALEDCRPTPGTHPPLLTGAIYSRTTRQAALWLVRRGDLLQPINRPVSYFLATRKPRRLEKPEKNWLLWLHGPDQLRGFYNACPHVLIEPGHDSATWLVTHKHNWNPPAWTRPLSRVLRGSTAPVALPSGRLLALWHLKDQSGGYWTGATLHAPDWPHNPEAATARPLFTPADASKVSPLWPPNTCVFPMFLELATSGLATLWAGDSDESCCVYRAPVDNLLRTMEPIR